MPLHSPASPPSRISQAERVATTGSSPRRATGGQSWSSEDTRLAFEGATAYATSTERRERLALRHSPSRERQQFKSTGMTESNDKAMASPVLQHAHDASHDQSFSSNVTSRLSSLTRQVSPSPSPGYTFPAPAAASPFTPPLADDYYDHRRASTSSSASEDLLTPETDFPFPPSTLPGEEDSDLSWRDGSQIAVGSAGLPSKAERLLGLAISTPQDQRNLHNSSFLLPSPTDLDDAPRMARSTSAPTLRPGSSLSNVDPSRRSSLFGRVGLGLLRKKSGSGRGDGETSLASPPMYNPMHRSSSGGLLSPDSCADLSFDSSLPEEDETAEGDNFENQLGSLTSSRRPSRAEGGAMSSKAAALLGIDDPASPPPPPDCGPSRLLLRSRKHSQRRPSATSSGASSENSSTPLVTSPGPIQTYAHDPLPPFPSRLGEFVPSELASDLFSLHLPSSAPLRRLHLRSDWSPRYLLLTTYPAHDPTEPSIRTLHLFRTPPIPAERETHRLELTADSHVFVPDDESLMASSATAGIVATLKISGLAPLERDELGRPLQPPGSIERKPVEWVVGMERTEMLSRWLKLLKNIVRELKQAALAEQALCGMIVPLPESPVTPKGKRMSIATVSTEGSGRSGGSGGSASDRRNSTWSDPFAGRSSSLTTDVSRSPVKSRTPHGASRSPRSRLDGLKEEDVLYGEEEGDQLDDEDVFGDEPVSSHPFAAAAAAATRTKHRPLHDSVGPRQMPKEGAGTRRPSTSDASSLSSYGSSTRHSPSASTRSPEPPMPPPTSPLPPPPPGHSIELAGATSGRRLSVATFATTATAGTTTSTSSQSSSSSFRSRLSAAPLPPPTVPLPALPSLSTIPKSASARTVTQSLPPPAFALGALPPPPRLGTR